VSQKLGKYEIIEEIGRGGFSVVYKALDTSLHNRPVALKVLHPHLLVDPTFVLRLQQEAGAAANLSHPNIVVVYEVGEIDGTYYIAMQYLPGTSLDELVKEEGPLAPPRAAKIIEQIASALDYAHQEGFIHRDVKSGNIIVGEDDHATLTDFGLVRAAEGTSLTSTGKILGTPEYMSPEQAQGREIDYRTDLYSLGVIAYEALTARVPFRGETPTATHYMHVHEDPPAPARVNPALPGGVEQVLLKALAKEKEKRFQSGRELAEALADAVVADEVKEEEAKPLLAAERVVGNPKRRVRPALAGAGAGWVVAGVLALVMIVVGFGVLLSGRGIPGAVLPTETPTPTLQPMATWTQAATAAPTSTALPTATATATATATSTPTATLPPTMAPAVPAAPPPTAVPPTATPTAHPAPPGMIYVPAGDYQLSDGTTVHLEAHYMDAQVATSGQYYQCVDDVACSPLWWGVDDSVPMGRATWEDAYRYCRWAGKRLPTLAEWQHACTNLAQWQRASPWNRVLWEWVADCGSDGERCLLCGRTCDEVREVSSQDHYDAIRCAANVE